MQLFDVRTAKVLTTLCAFMAVAAFLYGIRHTLVILLFAIMFAYLLEPMVVRLEASRMSRGSRGLAIAETYAAISLVLAVLGMVFGGRLLEDTRQLVQSLPALMERVDSGGIVWQVGSRHGWSFDTQWKISQFIGAHQQKILNWVTQAGSSTAQFLADAAWFILIPILAIFFLKEGRQYTTSLVRVFDRREQRRLLRSIIVDLDQMMAEFIFTQIMLAAASVVAYGVALGLLRFPYTLVLAVFGGILEFIPVVGPLVAAVVIVGVGFLTATPHLLIVIIFLGIWRLVRDYVISPRVMNGRLELHPFVSIAAVLMGGELGGVLGVFLSIPVAAAIRVIWKRWSVYVEAAEAAAKEAQLAEIKPRVERERVAS
ncbi:MAG: AI-2E family transporter [Candidatus Korobacteraceae bacterium]